MDVSKKILLAEVADYYSTKLFEFGESPMGVDWNGVGGQVARFDQLCKIINTQGYFSINDLGCGYGALYDYLIQKHESFSYFGIDISTDMIQTAKKRYHDKDNIQFQTSNKPAQVADYSVASGIFNVRLRHSDEEWLNYLTSTLDILNSSSSLGFAFNCLTSYSDADKMRDYLFYSDPLVLFDICKQRYSRNVTLLHDYDLYEFTILVRKKL